MGRSARAVKLWPAAYLILFSTAVAANPPPYVTGVGVIARFVYVLAAAGSAAMLVWHRWTVWAVGGALLVTAPMFRAWVLLVGPGELASANRTVGVSLWLTAAVAALCLVALSGRSLHQ